MDLLMNGALAARYTSAAQRARVVTEDWALRNLACLACEEDRLKPLTPGAQVSDFVCAEGHKYQLKAKQGTFGAKVANSAYEAKVAAIREGRAPNYLFMGYTLPDWGVRQLIAVPGHLLTLAAVEKRRPLSETARRAGWVGSNILLNQLPVDGRLPWIDFGKVMELRQARRMWQRFQDLNKKPPEKRAWIADVLAVVRRLQAEGRGTFTIDDAYAFEQELAQRHPDNRHVKPKIRQQLQLLRKRGILAFESRGLYRIVD